MVFEKVRSIISEQLDVAESKITMDTSFESLDIDSLDLFELIVELEEQFDIEIDETEDMKTVADVVNYIETSKKVN